MSQENIILEIARNPIPPDKSLLSSPTPAIDSQIATVMRDSIHSFSLKLYLALKLLEILIAQVEKVKKNSRRNPNRPETHFKNTNNETIHPEPQAAIFHKKKLSHAPNTTAVASAAAVSPSGLMGSPQLSSSSFPPGSWRPKSLALALCSCAILLRRQREADPQIQAYVWLFWGAAAATVTAAVETTAAAAAVAKTAAAAAVVTAAAVTVVAAFIALHHRNKRSNPLTAAVADGAAGAAGAACETATLRRLRHECQANLPGPAKTWPCWGRAAASCAAPLVSPELRGSRLILN